MKKKIINLIEAKNIKRFGKIVLCHGVFDLFHPGHLSHLKSAKKNGDILIVSITADKFVNKGPLRPYYNEIIRAEFLSNISFVDYVIISNDYTAVKIINVIKPNFYVKGQEYKDTKKDISKNILAEALAVKKNNGKIIFTNEPTLSSGNLLNSHFNIFNNEQKKKIQEIKTSGGLEYINYILEKIKKLNVTVIGETIIDVYSFCKVTGISSKSPTISAKFINNKKYMGGAFAVASDISSFVKKINLITFGIKKNINTKFFNNFKIKNYNIKNINAPEKTRYINENNQKIFELTKIHENFWSKKLYKKFAHDLNQDQNLNIITDFGHGFFDTKILNIIEKKNVFFTVNTQTNSSNFGYNLFTKYKSSNYLCLDLLEARLGLKDNSSDENFLIKKLISKIKNSFSVTVGSKGAYYFNYKQKKLYKSPAFSKEIIDPTGAGDSYFAMSSLLQYVQCKSVFIPFLSNVYASQKLIQLGHKIHKNIKVDFLKSITALLK
jgi:rfaE bifunctional protein nucleotidyltransferase chain/domain